MSGRSSEDRGNSVKWIKGRIIKIDKGCYEYSGSAKEIDSTDEL